MLLVWTKRLADYDRPALIVWAANDVMMPPEHGTRLAELLPNARLTVIEDSATLVPEDQPDELVRVLSAFLVQNGAKPVRS